MAIQNRDKVRDRIAREYTNDEDANSVTLGRKYKLHPSTVLKLLREAGIEPNKYGGKPGLGKEPANKLALSQATDGSKRTHRSKQRGMLVKKQKGRCAICRTKLSSVPSHVDHCHTTNKIRGVLCKNCNFGLGFFADDVTNLARAIAYLEKHR